MSHERAVPTATVTDPLEMFSYGGALMTASGSRLYLKGLNWFGERLLICTVFTAHSHQKGRLPHLK